MTLKHTIIGAILCVLTAMLFLAVGMNYAVRHLEIQPDASSETALVYLNDQVYIYDIERGE